MRKHTLSIFSPEILSQGQVLPFFQFRCYKNLWMQKMQWEYFHCIEVPMPSSSAISLDSRKTKDIMGGPTQNIIHMYYSRTV